MKEEHYSISWEPAGRYPNHFTPYPAVYPKKLGEGLYKHNATESCIVLGGDSTNKIQDGLEEPMVI